jgi:Tol biopolymer transport system component
MKPRTKTKLVLVFVSLILAASVIAAQQAGETPEVLLEHAIQIETVDGDLSAAIDLYKRIETDSASSRAVVARALLHLGECYEKLGNAEAQKAYQQVVQDYADQVEQAQQARVRLAALKSGVAASGRESTITIRRVPNLDMTALPSPDGKYLAYTDGGTGNLAVLEVVTGATRLLTKDGSWGDVTQFAIFAAWARDSKRIAYGWEIASAEEERIELRTVPLDRNAIPVTIATPGVPDILPVQWTRDGSRILCICQMSSGRRAELALVGVNTGEMEKLNLETGSGRWLESRLVENDSCILYSSPADGKAAPNDIYMRNLKTGATTAVVQHPAEDLFVGIVPDTDWLLFESDRRGQMDLWGVKFHDGKTSGTPVLVKQGIGRFSPLGFTDDGRYYYATISVTDDVFLADFDTEEGRITGEPRKLASRWEGTSMYPSFSPDGEHIAYVAQRGPMLIPIHSADSLVVQSLKNTKAEPTVVGFRESGLTNVDGPCWAEDGRSIVLSGSSIQESGLYRVDLPSLKVTEIYSGVLGYYDCSRHGRFVYLVKRAGDGSGSLIRLDIRGGNAREVYKAAPGRTNIAVSPDGQTISIIQSANGSPQSVQILPSKGGAARQIHEFALLNARVRSHTWSPDGKSIFCVIEKLPIDSGKRSYVITRIPVDGGEASEQSFESGGPAFGFQFDPSGRLVAFTGRNGLSTRSELWVIENLKDELNSLKPAVGE